MSSGPQNEKPSDSTGEGHKRRKRYRGTHPRSFGEKYKELQADRYREDVEKVLARGATPAGSHRPICVAEIMRLLAPKPGETAVDATLGYGGHALKILQAIQPGGRLVGLDRDGVELRRTEARLLAAGFPAPSLILRHSNFASLPSVLAREGIPGADLFLADLGVSSMQIDNPDRGFTFKRDGPLDMRMDTERGLSAADLLAELPEHRLRELLAENADIAEADEIALAVSLLRGELTTTRALADAIRSALPPAPKGDPAIARTIRRCFQAIRIQVNAEFSSLDTLLAALPSCLLPGGRAAILTFHSGEDRRVEASFNEGLKKGLYESVAAEPIRPSREEQYDNPRSSSAKLRWAVRSG
ncbi:MAG TPA: 16S rRNA (cytosine(1402)-N(4))-methyltransferase [Treponema sp.]|nr:MAG: 16S rRNA (cytosine(1402)-N(4))-methyltransferase [Treponema sp. GWA1_62_8]OHE68520.1 MAG: 16S rRNA (cytosine(1402)-N(4))-methyltransferase [Treponema sp. RIFOXYC1_FULL_61_9]OHE70182.1 MAG: 16S rRNA (cytosine(1402)-N(4))-methyltransferase [Treponema sp. GWC1_61_84]HCM28437.1 16S rRNA (cytosine(1402)-N(4))-methyltransferase [Treponema sp.]